MFRTFRKTIRVMSTVYVMDRKFWWNGNSRTGQRMHDKVVQCRGKYFICYVKYWLPFVSLVCSVHLLPSFGAYRETANKLWINHGFIVVNASNVSGRWKKPRNTNDSVNRGLTWKDVGDIRFAIFFCLYVIIKISSTWRDISKWFRSAQSKETVVNSW